MDVERRVWHCESDMRTRVGFSCQHERAWHVVAAVQSLSHIRLFVTPWTAAQQVSLSFTSSLSLLKFMLIELVMSFYHLILCDPLLLLSSVFPSLRVFSNKSGLYIKRPKYQSFNFSISPSSEYSGLIFF